MINKLRYLLTACLLGTIHANGQDPGNQPGTYMPWRGGARMHTGFLLNHHENMAILNEKAPYAVEIFVAKSADETEYWHSFYHNPQYGFSYLMFDLGSPSYLGKAHCIYPFMSFFLTGEHRTASLNMRIGTGIACVDKKFDRLDNYKNVAISTHLNAFLCLQMEGRIRMTESFYLSGGLAYSHMSNGAFQKPNSGLNYVTAFAGASYAFGREQPLGNASYLTMITDRKWRYTVYVSGGIKTASAGDGRQYTVTGLSMEASRTHLAFTRFNGTLDIFYDASDYASLTAKNIETRKIQTIKPGIAGGYAFLFGPLSTHVQMGAYLYSKYPDNGAFYQRLSLRYAVASRLNLQIGLKTHWGQADYVELAIGYRIR